MKKIISILLFFLCLAETVGAQHLVLRASAPGRVVKGEEFKVQYVINAADVTGTPAAKFPAAFDVLYGPSTSVMSSYQIINGKQSSSGSVTYTYVVSANKVGIYTIPAGTIKVKGRTIASSPLQITVLPEEKKKSNKVSEIESPKGSLSGKDLFIQAHANKTVVYEQEPVVLTYKVYTRANLKQLGGKVPDLKGFLIQEVNLPQQKTFHVENVNGRNYQMTVWSQYVLFPQQSGKLIIPNIKFEGIVSVPMSSEDFIDDFFNGESNEFQVKKVLNTPSIPIEVKKLPVPKPQGYSDAVGRFDISAQILNKSIRTNENLNLRIVISGIGNMKLIQAPKLNLSSDFDVYAPTVTNKTKLMDAGIKGSMIYDYIIIPKRKGHFTLPSVSFVYFNPESKKYETKNTNSLSFEVVQGKSLSGEDDGREQDIRPIHTKQVELHRLERAQGDEMFFIGWYVVCVVLFGASFFLLRKREKNRSNENYQKKKKANAVLFKYLKSARKQLKTNNKAYFYKALNEALRLYTSNRLSIPMADYSLTRVEAELQANNVPDDLIDQFKNIMAECEYIQYAPGGNVKDMSDVYKRTEEVLNEIEKVLRKNL